MTDGQVRADDLLPLLPTIEGGYRSNFIRQAVCELRFPTLMDLGGPKPPSQFVAALRKAYPYSETANEVTVGVGSSSGSVSSHSHILKSVKMTWTVSLRQNGVVLEATRYTTYAELRDRAMQVVEAALPVIDSDFFTRVGLRYVNVVSTDDSPMTEWINPTLSGPLLGQGFLGVSEYAGRIALNAEDGGCLLQHGLKHKDVPPGSPTPTPDYVLDIDAFRIEVPADEVMVRLDAAHQQAFSLFTWALGPRAKRKLSGQPVAA